MPSLVVKAEVKSAAMGTPDRLSAPVVTVTVYGARCPSLADGVKVAVLVNSS
jgi:hypothetical protein